MAGNGAPLLLMSRNCSQLRGLQQNDLRSGEGQNHRQRWRSLSAFYHDLSQNAAHFGGRRLLQASF